MRGLQHVEFEAVFFFEFIARTAEVLLVARRHYPPSNNSPGITILIRLLKVFTYFKVNITHLPK